MIADSCLFDVIEALVSRRISPFDGPFQCSNRVHTVCRARRTVRIYKRCPLALGMFSKESLVMVSEWRC